MEEHTSTPPRTYCWKLSEIPINPSALNASASHTHLRSASINNAALQDSTQSSDPHSREKEVDPRKMTASFIIRPATPRINLLKKAGKEAGALVDIFQNFEKFVRDMIERGEDVESEQDLYLRMLAEYLGQDKDKVAKLQKIEIVVDTSNLTLQAIGQTLTELVELKLNRSIIKSVRDIGTSFKSLKILWVSRVGLQDLSGISLCFNHFRLARLSIFRRIICVL